MFEFFPWQYTRLVSIGHIYPNNTATFTMTYLDPTTWQKENSDILLCPLASKSSTEGANFFVI
jgi:hypothetical protein